MWCKKHQESGSIDMLKLIYLFVFCFNFNFSALPALMEKSSETK